MAESMTPVKTLPARRDVRIGDTWDLESLFSSDREWEAALLGYATDRLGAIDGLRIIGTAAHKAGLVSFVVDGVHPHDLGTILDEEGVAIRTGHHCAMPAIEFFKVPATARASFGLYTTLEEIDQLALAIETARDMFR